MQYLFKYLYTIDWIGVSQNLKNYFKSINLIKIVNLLNGHETNLQK